MPANRTLYLTPHQIQSFSWQRGRCAVEALFDANEPGEAFASHLLANRTSRWSIVTNVAEEGFHQESIPFLQSSDRQTVIRRRLNQLFQGSPFAVEQSLGFEKTRRKDERLLLLGLTNPAQLDPTIKRLLGAEARLAGIYSLPLLSSALLEKLRIPLKRTLLVTLQDHTIRQTYFDGGRLVFSRVSPLGDSSTLGVSQSTSGEVARFQQYLLSQRTISRNDALDVHLLLHASIAQAVATTLPGNETLRFHVHDLDQVAKKVGLECNFADSRCQALFVHLANAATPRQQFAPPELRKNFRLWQASRAMVAAGVIGLAGAAIFSAKTWIDTNELRSSATARIQEAESLDARYQSVVATFPPVPVAKETLNQVISRYAAIERETRFPQPMLSTVSSALNQHPGVEISRIDWGIGEEVSNRLNREIGTDREVLVVEGTIRVDANGSPRDLLAEFEAFSQKVLGPADRQQELLVLQQPFDVTSETSLKSGGGELSTSEPRAFALALLRRVTP